MAAYDNVASRLWVQSGKAQTEQMSPALAGSGHAFASVSRTRAGLRPVSLNPRFRRPACRGCPPCGRDTELRPTRGAGPRPICQAGSGFPSNAPTRRRRLRHEPLARFTAVAGTYLPSHSRGSRRNRYCGPALISAAVARLWAAVAGLHYHLRRAWPLTTPRICCRQCQPCRLRAD